jgi:glycosyltransferase involved in cell wall biosynthesis
MKIGIDASNLREGGGRTHLIELLRHGDGNIGGIDRVVVWASRETLDELPSKPWLEARHEPMLDHGLFQRVAWQQTRLPALVRDVDLLFAPGGITTPVARPRVVMSQNMLPFDGVQRRRNGVGPRRLRLELLRHVQSRNFVSADGVIFLTAYAKREVCRALPRGPRRIAVIPHGVGERFRMGPRPQPPRSAFVADRPLRLLYVSAVSPYKNHLNLLAAVATLRRELPVELTLVGPPRGAGAGDRLRQAIGAMEHAGNFVRYLGEVRFDEVHRCYRQCDVFVFASSCENMPNILVEAMSSGLPIACARRGPMPEILGDAGVYFDPEDVDDIAAAIRRLADDANLRFDLGARAHERSKTYSWDRCARATFGFLEQVAAARLTSSLRSPPGTVLR